MADTSGELPGWRDGAAKQQIVEFVARSPARMAAAGSRRGARRGVRQRRHVVVREAAADPGRLHPSPALRDGAGRPELRDRQPWKAAYTRDYAWLGKVIAEHYAGDDTNLPALASGILAAFGGITVEEFESESDAFLRTAQHPTLGRGYLECAYAPMVELLGYLETNGFSSYIASGGGRDFMRPISRDVYGIPRERVIGSAPPSSTRATPEAARSRTRRRPTISTTVRRSRSGSGAALAAARSSLPAIPMAISRCSSSRP